MEYAAAVIIGYLFGSVSFAYIISKIRGVDILSKGSHNPGASNVFLSVGKIYGVIVGALDISKAILAAYFISSVFPEAEFAPYLAGAMAVVGHCFPVWMHFSGGKGFAPFMGLVLFTDWRVFLALVLIVAIITLVTDFIALGTLFSVTVMPFYTAIVQSNILIPILFVLIAIMLYILHRGNIKRIKNGTEIGLRKNHGNI